MEPDEGPTITRLPPHEPEASTGNIYYWYDAPPGFTRMLNIDTMEIVPGCYRRNGGPI